MRQRKICSHTTFISACGTHSQQLSDCILMFSPESWGIPQERNWVASHDGSIFCSSYQVVRAIAMNFVHAHEDFAIFRERSHVLCETKRKSLRFRDCCSANLCFGVRGLRTQTHWKWKRGLREGGGGFWQTQPNASSKLRPFLRKTKRFGLPAFLKV